MKNYVVAFYQKIGSQFNAHFVQFKIEAESPYEAVKKANLEWIWDKYKQIEIDFQNSKHYPKSIEELKDYLADNCDLYFSVIEVGSFLQ